MSDQIYKALLRMSDISVTRFWAGSALALQDINRRSLKKYFAFSGLLFKLLVSGMLANQRYDFVYLTLAPKSHTVFRDALLALTARSLGNTVLVHLHGDGLCDRLARTTLSGRLLRFLLNGSVLIGARSKALGGAEASGVFSAFFELPNAVPDPGTYVREQSNDLRLGYLANLDPRKGALVFVEAVADMVRLGIPVRAVIAGASTPMLSQQQLEKYVAMHGLEKTICVVGPVHGSAKVSFWRNLDVFLYLTNHDYAPLVILEALSYGVSPVVRNVGAISGMLAPTLASNILSSTLSAMETKMEVVKVVQQYQSNRGKLAADQAQARALYVEQFSLDRLRCGLRKLFKSEEPD